ncbi:MAG TPA: terpene cyclase/mutase family protein [Planctomycetota bacterium]|nr:terpene cyclase/mutase family protein [Planctomycetota bacterium]OQC20031.1 MAG: Prenyltransferase and squalene oxidase repeat protein [Planctomycetes bacterium ADurb.Bin069]HNR99555.1 terpene cyclase/mutase family protein [Planctomycetota bacterium]HNU26509.1 terpene cyclase/mutase family protein [Planctomycetota bacterium]HOE28421.1 terpene cyclase/mutase family protein [Planctomycetota bacterium]
MSLISPAMLVMSAAACAAVAPSEIELSSARGLAALAARQDADGAYATVYQVAGQGLAGLAFLACGHTPKQGPHAPRLRLGLKRLLSYQDDNGYFNDGKSSMYGHGFATLYLAEVLGMWGEPREELQLREALKKAVGLIERAQNSRGGWDYSPDPGGIADCSITVCQTMALRAARNIGLAIDARVVAAAFRYIRAAQTEDGGFRYRLGGPSIHRQVTIGCSAAGVCILNGLGEYDTDSVRRGVDFVKKHCSGGFSSLTLMPGIQSPFYYTHYYASQALFRTRGRAWDDYFDYIAPELIRRQRQDGSWTEREGGGDIPATAMAVFILNVPRALLPITGK